MYWVSHHHILILFCLPCIFHVNIYLEVCIYSITCMFNAKIVDSLKDHCVLKSLNLNVLICNFTTFLYILKYLMSCLYCNKEIYCHILQYTPCVKLFFLTIWKWICRMVYISIKTRGTFLKKSLRVCCWIFITCMYGCVSVLLSHWNVVHCRVA